MSVMEVICFTLTGGGFERKNKKNEHVWLDSGIENQFAESFYRSRCGSQAVLLPGFTQKGTRLVAQEGDWLLPIR